jgi:hypothetical protein
MTFSLLFLLTTTYVFGGESVALIPLLRLIRVLVPSQTSWRWLETKLVELRIIGDDKMGDYPIVCVLDRTPMYVPLYPPSLPTDPSTTGSASTRNEKASPSSTKSKP